MSEKPLFGKFKIIECFKKDESLAVYLADHIYLNKQIILKTLNTGNISDQVVLERFKREAQLLAKINHPNIISIYDFGTFGEYFYISFEYFEGQNLRQAFKNNSWSIEEKIDILNQIATGLSETHSKKVIHRDLKPENILINNENHVKIADFGLAQISGGEKLTAAEAIVGTPAYMTPEQIQGINSDERSDLFSFGILIYEMFFGVNPFLGKDAGQTLNNIQTCRINTPPPHAGMPDYIPVIIDRLLKKSQSDRPKSVEFIFKFTGKALEKNDRQKKNIWKYLITALLFVIVVLAAYFIMTLMEEKQTLAENKENIADSLNTKKPFGELPIIVEETDSEKATEPIVVSREPLQQEPGDTQQSIVLVPDSNLVGYIDIKCKPWAEVLIDSNVIDTTPIKEPYKLLTGEYRLQLRHPNYPVYTSKILVRENDTLQINVNLQSMVGYLVCNVFPWGDIYINNTFVEQTPLNHPIILEPGTHILEIKNPGYESQRNEIRIEKSDTLKMTIKLNALVNSD